MIPRRQVHITRDDFKMVMKAFAASEVTCKKYLAQWEEEFSAYVGTRYGIMVSSGRCGLELILKSLDIHKGDEVIIPAYTLKDLVYIIQSLGLKVVLADINKDTFNIDPQAVADRITEKTKVILATHLFGSPCQIDRILEIAKNKSIFVIEDCAHSTGAEFKGRKTGSFGHAAFFSFETIKLINTYGAEMVLTNDEKLAHTIRQISHFRRGKGSIPLKKMGAACLERILLSTPFSFPMLYLLASERWNKKVYSFYRQTQKMSTVDNRVGAFQAILGLTKLKTLDQRIAVRRRQAASLSALLSSSIVPQKSEFNASPNYYFFVALVSKNPWRIRRFLLKHGIDAGVGAEIADDCSVVLGEENLHNVRYVFRSSIHLPLCEGISDDHFRYVAKVVNKACI